MKRMVCVLLLITMMLSLMAACSDEKEVSFKCDICREVKTGKKYTESILGEEFVYCKDCKDGLASLF